MFNNPYINPYMQYQQPAQSSQVTRVNGENGARAYQMGPNSSALLLDEGGTIVWLVITDGAGYKTVSPYDITPHQAVLQPDIQTLEQRISRLEEMINGNTADTSTATGNKPSGKSGSD